MTYLFGNWKMYSTIAESHTLIDAIATMPVSGDASVAVFPNPVVTQYAVDKLTDHDTAVGAQNVIWTPQGAYTGATSAHLYAEMGVTYALVGHSERRHIFGETDEDVRKKVAACIDAGIIPVLCIGETKEDLDQGKTEYRLKKQLQKALDGVSILTDQLIIAYEPVWAISHGGEGTPCTPEQAATAHAYIKKEVATYTDTHVPVLYGGSVSPTNIASYLGFEEVDGVLVGHASIDADAWKQMIDVVTNT